MQINLTEQQLRNLIAFLNRTNLQPPEIKVFLDLLSVLEKAVDDSPKNDDKK